MTDPYAQEKAIAMSMQEAIDRNERATILGKLDEILALLKASTVKVTVKAKE